MSDKTLSDRIAGARMRVDQEFEDRVEASSFSRQQWGLVMTAIEFDIEEDESGEPKLVANSEKLSSVMAQVEDAGNRDPTMGGPAGGGGGTSGSSGGIFSAVTDALGFGGAGGGGKSALQEEAEQLADAYAEELQAHLEKRGRWESIRSEVDD